jgi:hypothetical protein
MRNFKIERYRSRPHWKLLNFSIKHFSKIICRPKLKWKLVARVYLNLIIEFVMLNVVSFVLHIKHLSSIDSHHFLPIHIPCDFKRPELHHICDIVNLRLRVSMTVHLPSLLHPILTPVLHVKYHPLITPLSYLDLSGDHVLRLEPK